ncbi:MAG TPA: efflux RND transporter periplasmic adaptor subunit [Vicinamibacterales bacterium]|nr:efflux RND transporter periplasmic adaptor subunit [Vicinamibacterales bacterium]
MDICVDRPASGWRIRRAARRLLTALCAATAVAACSEPPAPPPPPPPEVYVADVVRRDVPVFVDLVGQMEGDQDVDIRARVEGFLETVRFQEGEFVRKGDLLYEIDRKPFEAALAAAKAEQATAAARLNKADGDVARYRPLAAKQAVSQQELDNALAAQDAARSQVDAAKAAVEQASINLGYTRIHAPIDGLIGTTQMKAGNLVGRGENTLLTTISQINPIIFRVGVTEADYLRVFRRRQEAAGKDPVGAQIELTLADNTVYPHKGRLGPIERAIDPTSGTLAVQFIFPNPQALLRPGQYARSRLVLDTQVGALAVPQRAVQELQNLYSVAIVGADNKVTFRNVKVGQKVDSLWVIEEGVAAGDKVIVEGIQRVQEGATVTARPAPPAGSGGEAK